jgi:adenine C2-methylase RlmN of 23S rRNA A2503 and tRNA A37
VRWVVNLIPYNPQRDAAYETPRAEVALAFLSELRRNKSSSSGGRRAAAI